MKLILAGGALLMMTAGAAFAQGTTSTTTSNPNTTNPSTMTPATMAPGNPAPGTTAPVANGSGAMAPNAMRMATPGSAPTRQPTNPVVQTPGATVNTTAQSNASPSPSAMQTHDSTSRTAAAPVPGRNSFTMGQARRRIASAGFTNVKDLKKDDQGIWRGQATKDGASKSVALDYQGNVVGQ
jgi:protein CpxP